METLTDGAVAAEWRRRYADHPCASVFPMMTEKELEKLADDIRQNGLQHPIVLVSQDSSEYVLDGRNRLAAAERAELVLHSTDFIRVPPETDVARFVISRNIRRRHLTKKQQAELIWRTFQASQGTESANVARSAKRDERGHLRGSERDPILAAAVDEGKKQGISKRTIQNARASVRGKIKPSSPGEDARQASEQGVPNATISSAMGEIMVRTRRLEAAGYSTEVIMNALKQVLMHYADTLHLSAKSSNATAPQEHRTGATLEFGVN